jgi:hypothetical protein
MNGQHGAGRIEQNRGKIQSGNWGERAGFRVQGVEGGGTSVPSGIGSGKVREEATDFTDGKPIWKSGKESGSAKRTYFKDLNGRFRHLEGPIIHFL